MLDHTDAETGKPFVDVVKDAAEQKGTGRWTVQSALDLGVPVTGIAEATFARSLSGHTEQRAAARKVFDTDPEGAPTASVATATAPSTAASPTCATRCFGRLDRRAARRHARCRGAQLQRPCWLHAATPLGYRTLLDAGVRSTPLWLPG